MVTIKRIAVIGSVGTGKTTVVNELLKHIYLPIIPEGVRDILQRYRADTNNDMTNPTCLLRMETEILSRRLRQEEESRNTGFIADRSVIDQYSFIVYYCHKLLESRKIGGYERLCKDAIYFYDIIFYLPFGTIPYLQDADREETYGDAYMEDLLLCGLLHKWHVPYQTVRSTTLIQRIQEVLAILKKFGYKHE